MSPEADSAAHSGPKVQFNVYLPASLVRDVKHTAVDAGMSLSAFVEDVLSAHVKGK